MFRIFLFLLRGVFKRKEDDENRYAGNITQVKADILSFSTKLNLDAGYNEGVFQE